MRTLIGCRSRLGNAELEKILDAYSWLPGRPEGDQTAFDEMIDARVHAILETIPPDKREAARNTLVCALNAADLDTWGIVTKEQTHTYYFRLVNHNARKLRVLSERLVRNLRDEAPRQLPGSPSLVFTGYVSILEQGSDRETQRGTFVAPGIGGLLRERRWEALLTVAVFTFAVVAFIFSYPKEPPAPQTLAGAQHEWWYQFWGRLGTAILVPAIVALLQGIFLVLNRARHAVIAWKHK